ncbi:hypothetical protein [Aeromonas veronii]|uniref:hypothetical protein n=1 Tax=Aeromonas veronii TaxID=654 RepID=UPI003D1E05ED
MAASLYWSLSKLRKGAAFIPFCEADHCVALTQRAAGSGQHNPLPLSVIAADLAKVI